MKSIEILWAAGVPQSMKPLIIRLAVRGGYIGEFLAMLDEQTPRRYKRRMWARS